MATEREQKTQRKTMDVIEKYGGYVYKNAQSIYTEKGRPDLTACVPTTLATLEKMFGKNAKVGIFIGIEMKRPGCVDDTSNAQEIVGRKIKKASGLWFAIDNPDIVEALMLRLTEENDVKQN